MQQAQIHARMHAYVTDRLFEPHTHTCARMHEFTEKYTKTNTDLQATMCAQSIMQTYISKNDAAKVKVVEVLGGF